MPQYGVVMRLDPPRCFGLPDPGFIVVPVRQRVAVEWNPESGSVVDRSSWFRGDTERLVASVTVNGIRFRVHDDRLSATVEAEGAVAAMAAIGRETRRLLDLTSTLSSADRLSFRIIEATEDGSPIDPSPMLELRAYAYDLNATKAGLLQASALLDGLSSDPRLDQALRYFAIGDNLRAQAWASLDSGLEPLCFLQYWKALATVAGDPSADRDHQTRTQELGLGKDFFSREIRPLHRIRDSFGVAHIASLDDPPTTSTDGVGKCRSIAAEVIGAYAKCPTDTKARWNRSTKASSRSDGAGFVRLDSVG